MGKPSINRPFNQLPGLVNMQKAMERSHKITIFHGKITIYSGFTHQKWSFSIAMLVITRGYDPRIPGDPKMSSTGLPDCHQHRPYDDRGISWRSMDAPWDVSVQKIGESKSSYQSVSINIEPYSSTSISISILILISILKHINQHASFISFS